MDVGNRQRQILKNESKDIIRSLEDRKMLLDKAKETELNLSPEAAVYLQENISITQTQCLSMEPEPITNKPTAILESVKYRLAITDLFVEKAQYHLEQRARKYRTLGYTLYSVAILLFLWGVISAGSKMKDIDQKKSIESKQSTVTQVHGDSLALTAALPTTQASFQRENKWIDLLHGFVVAFTAYGFIVLTAVALVRGARACLDQRERLLAKRHSLRQGRLYLHLSGGHVSIDDMERAFNWNHEQNNAFTNMPTDAKAPWGNVIEEMIKIVPELVKTGVSAAEKKNSPVAKP
jgi:hypothetical protein